MKKILPLIFALCAALSPLALSAFPAGESEQIAEVASAPAVRVVSSGIEVHNPDSEPCAVEVYALTGRLVLREQAQSGVTSFSLPPGHYIVRLNTKSTKIVVR